MVMESHLFGNNQLRYLPCDPGQVTSLCHFSIC